MTIWASVYMQPSRSLFFPSRLMSSQMHSSYFVMSFKLLLLGFRDRCMYMHTPLPRSSRFSNSSYPSMCSSQRSMAYLAFEILCCSKSCSGSALIILLILLHGKMKSSMYIGTSCVCVCVCLCVCVCVSVYHQKMCQNLSAR